MADTARETTDETTTDAAPHVCFDRILPQDLLRPHRRERGDDGADRAISPIGKAWPNGSRLTVSFTGGTAAERNTARTEALWWEQACNVSFDFGNHIAADIRITFDPSLGAWSYVGTDCKSIPADEPTMNLGFLDGGTSAHEFGHAIGLSDLDDSGKLTMHFQGTLGYTGQRTLGRGDILGARALYAN